MCDPSCQAVTFTASAFDLVCVVDAVSRAFVSGGLTLFA